VAAYTPAAADVAVGRVEIVRVVVVVGIKSANG
jgi:hypothetical protein